MKLDRVHSKIGFRASTLLFDVDGRFHEYAVAFQGPIDDLSKARVEVEIDASSIDTDNKKRDEHLRSADFLDVSKHPTIRFTSRRIVEHQDSVEVTGTLDLHGRSKSVTIAFRKVMGEDGEGVEKTAFRGKLTLDRTAFGVGTDSIAAKISLEDEITLEFLIVAFL